MTVRIPLTRERINHRLDSVTRSLEEWLDEKQLLDALTVAEEGLYLWRPADEFGPRLSDEWIEEAA